MFTPSHVIKTRIAPRRAYFARYACRAIVELPGRELSSCAFYGNDGRKTRAEAIEWAHQEAERQAQIHCTAWRDVRDSKRIPWGE
jgi:hypothetical protein